MPLHLLGKKSWNVYNAANIARVKQDEADAVAREEAEEQRMQEEDAARRVAILRGEKVPSLVQPESTTEDASYESRSKDPHAVERRRQRRLRGEDDTDRDMRLAREDAAAGQQVAKRLLASSSHVDDETPLVDEAGHIQLIPTPHVGSQNHDDHSSHRSKRHKKPDKDTNDEGMRFRDAAGYHNDTSSRPWYTNHKSRSDPEPNDQPTKLSALDQKDLWGNEDPRRREREQTRMVSNDPFAMMQVAQRQLKQSELDRRKWQKEREAELDRPKREHRRPDHRRDRDRRRRTSDANSLDGFMLDRVENPRPNVKAGGEERHRHHSHRSDHHGTHRHRHRDRSRSGGLRRSRSPRPNKNDR